MPVGSGIPRRKIVRKLCRADELVAPGKENRPGTAAELEVSAATLYNLPPVPSAGWICCREELKELREQNTLLKRLLAEAELEKDVLWVVAKRNFESSCEAARRGHAERC